MPFEIIKLTYLLWVALGTRNSRIYSEGDLDLAEQFLVTFPVLVGHQQENPACKNTIPAIQKGSL